MRKPICIAFILQTNPSALCSFNSLETLSLVRKIIVFSHSSEPLSVLFYFVSFPLLPPAHSDNVQAAISVQHCIHSPPCLEPSCLSLLVPLSHLPWFILLASASWPTLREMQLYCCPTQNLLMTAHSFQSEICKAWSCPCLPLLFIPLPSLFTLQKGWASCQVPEPSGSRAVRVICIYLLSATWCHIFTNSSGSASIGSQSAASFWSLPYLLNTTMVHQSVFPGRRFSSFC